ncbi:MAG: hypothetical protein KF773_31755 [Deltaproteobacteria bacterium]|nr:hypothetical protein [Deltaproteobacteria bacterium]
MLETPRMSNHPYPQQPPQSYPQPGYPQHGYEQQPPQGYPPPHAPQLQPPPQPGLSQAVKTAAIVLGVAAVAILIGVVSKSWFTGGGGEGHVGISGIEACRRGNCVSISWGDIPKSPGELKAFSYITLIGGIASIGVLLTAVVMLLTGNVKKVPWKGFNAVLGITVFGAVSFMFRLMFGEFSKGMSLSWAGFVMLAGIIGGSIALAKLVRPEAERTT